MGSSSSCACADWTCLHFISMDPEELKKMKIVIKRKIDPGSKISDAAIDYSYSNSEPLNMLFPVNQKKQLFDGLNIHQRSISPQQGNSRNQQDDKKNKRRNYEQQLGQLDAMITDLKKEFRSLAPTEEERHKRTRRRSISSPTSDRRRSRSRSPACKRLRKDSMSSNRKPRRSSRSNQSPHRYRSRSSNSSSKSSLTEFLSRTMEREMSIFAYDSSLYTDSSRSRSKFRSPSRKSNKFSRRSDDPDNSRHQRNASHRYEDRHDHYQQMTYHDMKERYARYYTVMCAFNIIMDILRKDDLYYSA